jgi:hypothetical protein
MTPYWEIMPPRPCAQPGDNPCAATGEEDEESGVHAVGKEPSEWRRVVANYALEGKEGGGGDTQGQVGADNVGRTGIMLYIDRDSPGLPRSPSTGHRTIILQDRGARGGSAEHNGSQ